MKQEDKQLLLADLCARLSYGVHLFTNSKHHIRLLTISNDIDYNEQYWVNGLYDIDEVKPYLRPMSSMTEEEKNKFINYAGYEVEESINGRHYEYYLKDFVGTKEEPIANVDAIDWLNAHHFDYRNLIERGLAIDCTDLNVY